MRIETISDFGSQILRVGEGLFRFSIRNPQSAIRNSSLFVVLVLAGLAAAGACGCHNLFAWAFAERHPKETIKSEYNLEADRLVIVPYAGTEILFNDPTAPVEVSSALVNEIGLHLRPRIKTIVHPVEVTRWQESNLEWPNMTLPDIAKAFQADTLLYVELEQFTMTEERSANLLRGHAKARVQVVKADSTRNPVFETTVETLVPEDRPVGVLEVSERQIRMATTVMFSRAIMRKFYDHEVEVKGGKL
jgi:hypothetical protein